MTRVLEAEAEEHLDKALAYPTVEGRYAALLQLYLLVPDDRADLLAVAVFRRLAVLDVSASVASSHPCSEESCQLVDVPASERAGFRAAERRSVLDWVSAVFPRVRS